MQVAVGNVPRLLTEAISFQKCNFIEYILFSHYFSISLGTELQILTQKPASVSVTSHSLFAKTFLEDQASMFVANMKSDTLKRRNTFVA